MYYNFEKSFILVSYVRFEAVYLGVSVRLDCEVASRCN